MAANESHHVFFGVFQYLCVRGFKMFTVDYILAVTRGEGERERAAD